MGSKTKRQKVTDLGNSNVIRSTHIVKSQMQDETIKEESCVSL